jgi:16S rRNA (cytosine967-C5)-methyltransferase
MSVAGSQQRTILELLSQLRPHWRRDRNLPARIQNLLAQRRAFGSRDRRLYRELIYTTLRYLPWIEPHLGGASSELALQLIAWFAAESPTTDHFRRALLKDWPPISSSLAEKTSTLAQMLVARGSGETGTLRPDDLLPGWFREHCPEAFAPTEIDALLRRAPLWLRLQTEDRAAVADEFAQLGWACGESKLLPNAWRLFADVDVTKTNAFQRGALEIQDLASQLVLASAGVSPSERWLDACAGAGGKTLQLSGLLGRDGAIDAYDVRADALEELTIRARRAGIPVDRSKHLSSSVAFAPIRVVNTIEAEYDGVLVDAPCSGSGTWRRAPHLKWTTTPADVEGAAKLQSELLSRFSRHVRPQGRLIYATCSLSRKENDDVIAAFLGSHADFSIEPATRDFGGLSQGRGVTFLPATYDTDGFFVACLRRR